MSGAHREMTAEDVCLSLGLEKAIDVVSSDWDESGKRMPEGLPYFLEPEYIASAAQATAMPAPMAQALAETGRTIAGDGRLVRLAWHAHWSATEGDASRTALSRWPVMKNVLGHPHDLFYAVVSLGGLPRLREAHARRGVPQSVSAATLQAISLAIRVHKERFGHYGLTVGSFNYFRRLFEGELFHLQRLQFHFNPFRSRLKAFRRDRDGVVVAISEGGVVYRADGELYVQARGDTTRGVWTSSYFETEESVKGYPITPRGKAVSRPVTLSKKEWRCILQPGDPVLQIHIPGGSPMDFDACGRSLSEACRFFADAFPERSFKAFACNSWLLDDQLEDMLPPQSNLVRFLREMYRFPTAGNTEATLRWIYGTPPKDLSNAPQETTLQKRLIAHLLSGGEMVGGATFLMIDDLDWGTQPYRSQDLSDLLPGQRAE